MSIEQTIVPLLAAAIPTAAVRYGFVEQHDDDEPPQYPYVVVQRIGSAWGALDTTCGSNTALAEVQIQIDCYALQPFAARQLADTVRATMATLETPPSLDVEFDDHEPGTRLHRVSATYTCWDYAPGMVTP